MKIIAIKDEANGNETIGTMWKETKIFQSSDPISEIIKWAAGQDVYGNIRLLAKNVIITTADYTDEKDNV